MPRRRSKSRQISRHKSSRRSTNRLKYRSGEIEPTTLTQGKFYKVKRSGGITKPYTAEITFKYLQPTGVKGGSEISIHKIEVTSIDQERVSEMMKFYKSAFQNLSNNFRLLDIGGTTHFFHSDKTQVALEGGFGPPVETTLTVYVEIFNVQHLPLSPHV